MFPASYLTAASPSGASFFAPHAVIEKIKTATIANIKSFSYLFSLKK
jgi:hypothetical protein